MLSSHNLRLERERIAEKDLRDLRSTLGCPEIRGAKVMKWVAEIFVDVKVNRLQCCC